MKTELVSTLKNESQQSANEVGKSQSLQQKIDVLTRQKQKIIEEMTAIRKQFNVACYDQHKKTKEVSALRSEKETMELQLKAVRASNEKKIRHLNDKLTEKNDMIRKASDEKEKTAANLAQTKAELSQCQRKLKEQIETTAEKTKTISLLSGQNRSLLARLKQYDTNLAQRQQSGVKCLVSSKSITTKAAEGEYEVQQILSHKIKGGKRFFLIRWRGYSPEGDTWESESNLTNCPKILSSYLKTKNLRS